MVSVDPDKLKLIMDRLDENDKEIKRLTAAASKAGLAHYDDANRGDLESKVFFRTYGGKVIAAWQRIKDVVQKDAFSKAWIEDQTTRLFFTDGTEVEVPDLAFVNSYVLLPALVKAKTQLANGQWVYKVQAEDGVEYDFDTRFLN